MTLEIFAPGEKIRRLRENMGLKQDDLTDDKITRSLVSMIENGKRNLTYNVAAIIADKLNKYYEKIGQEFTAEDLLKDGAEQAQAYINEILTKYETISQNKHLTVDEIALIFNPLLSLAQEWRLGREIAKINLIRGQYYYHLCEYYKAANDYFSAIEYYIEVKDYEKIATLYLKLGDNSFMLEHIQEALVHFQKCYNLSIEKNPENEKNQIYASYNIILCYRKLKNYNLVFEAIENIRKYKLSQFIFDDIVLIEANNYLDLELYDKAEKLYSKLLKKEPDHRLKMLIFDSLTNLHINKEQYDIAFDFAMRSLELKDEVDRMYSSMIIVTVARSYHKLGKSKEAIKFINEYLINNRIPSVEKIDILLQLAEILKDITDYESAEKITYEIIELIHENFSESKLKAAYALLCEIYVAINNLNGFKKYIDLIKIT